MRRDRLPPRRCARMRQTMQSVKFASRDCCVCRGYPFPIPLAVVIFLMLSDLLFPSPLRHSYNEQDSLPKTFERMQLTISQTRSAAVRQAILGRQADGHTTLGCKRRVLLSADTCSANSKLHMYWTGLIKAILNPSLPCASTSTWVAV